MQQVSKHFFIPSAYFRADCHLLYLIFFYYYYFLPWKIETVPPDLFLAVISEKHLPVDSGKNCCFFFRAALGTPVQCPNIKLLKEIGMADTLHWKRNLVWWRREAFSIAFFFFLFERTLKKKGSLNITAKLLQGIKDYHSTCLYTSALWLLPYWVMPLGMAHHWLLAVISAIWPVLRLDLMSTPLTVNNILTANTCRAHWFKPEGLQKLVGNATYIDILKARPMHLHPWTLIFILLPSNKGLHCILWGVNY